MKFVSLSVTTQPMLRCTHTATMVESPCQLRWTFLGKMFLWMLILSGSIDVHITTSSTSQVTIEKMRSTFATLGLPEMLVTDNGPAFMSAEFAQFTKPNGIRHVTTLPYHPASNGLAEHAVQTFKEGVKRLVDGSLETRVARFLFKYRLTPQSTTGVSPDELMFGRPLRSQLDLLQPNLQASVNWCTQESQASAPTSVWDDLIPIDPTVDNESDPADFGSQSDGTSPGSNQVPPRSSFRS